MPKGHVSALGIEARILSDIVVLADSLGVLDANRPASEAKATFQTLKAAFEDNRVNAAKVSRRTVKAALSALEAAVDSDSIRVRHDLVTNPFQSPHSLAWYFGTLRMPIELRAFVADLTGRAVRVWSVAQNETGWLVLAENLIQDGSRASAVLDSEAKRAARKFKEYAIKEVRAYSGASEFAEVELLRLAPRAVLRRGEPLNGEGRIPYRPEQLATEPDQCGDGNGRSYSYTRASASAASAACNQPAIDKIKLAKKLIRR